MGRGIGVIGGASSCAASTTHCFISYSDESVVKAVVKCVQALTLPRLQIGGICEDNFTILVYMTLIFMLIRCK